MSQYQRYQQQQFRDPVAVGRGRPQASSREKFIVRTYNHLFLAILAFAAIEIGLFMSGIAESIAMVMSNNWMLVLGAFIITGWIASSVAHRAKSMTSQYLALAAYVGIEALIFVPILYIANEIAPGAIQSAAMVTILGFAALTGVAFYTRKDFSFLRGILMFGGIMALVAIGAALLFNFQLGVWFSVAMVALAGASILYNTSNVLHHYPENAYVAAALELFSSVALMFWYVLRIFLAARD